MAKSNPLEDLQEIRKMMEGSSKFLSLSGLSGVFAGITGLVGTYLAWLQIVHFEKLYMVNAMAGTLLQAEWKLFRNLGIMALVILIVAVTFGFFFTWLKARKENQKLVTPISFR